MTVDLAFEADRQAERRGKDEPDREIDLLQGDVEHARKRSRA